MVIVKYVYVSRRGLVVGISDANASTEYPLSTGRRFIRWVCASVVSGKRGFLSTVRMYSTSAIFRTVPTYGRLSTHVAS